MGVSRNKYLDKLHVRAVNTIWAFSGCCAIYLGYRMYRFAYYTLPFYKDKRHQVEQELISEGKPSEEDLSAAY